MRAIWTRNNPMILYGFAGLEDHWADKIEDFGVRQIDTAITQSLQEHTRQLNALMSLFVMQTTEFKLRFGTVSHRRNQPLDEDGRTRPIQPHGHYDVAWPLQDSGANWGANWRTRRKFTVGQVNNIMAAITEGDLMWTMDHIVSALLIKDPWDFDDEEHGTLRVKGMANNDGTVYNLMRGAKKGSKEDHFMVWNKIEQADTSTTLQLKADGTPATATGNPFEYIADHLRHHPENGSERSEIFTIIPTNLKADVRKMKTFHRLVDPRMVYNVMENRLADGADLNENIPGEVLGYEEISGTWIVWWRSMPSNYMITIHTGGEPALTMRQDEDPGLQGFFSPADREDYPWWEREYIRIAGWGAWNRLAAFVTQCNVGSADGTSKGYVVPTGYQAPMK